MRGRHCFVAIVTLLAACSSTEPDASVEPYPPLPEPTTSEARACIGEHCIFSTVAAALDAARDGDTVRILPGVYRDGGIVRAHHVTIEAEGAYLFEASWERKANIVVKGNDATIRGLRCSHIRVPDLNGACIRAEGKNLTLTGVHFHDAQTGLLTGRHAGRVVIEDSTFERLGNRAGEQANAHSIYVGAVDELVLRRTRVIHPIGKGHGVKSRAAKTVIEDSIVASLDGRGSRQIDLPNGGDITIRGNVLEKGPGSVSTQLIGIGHERGRHGPDHAVNQATIVNNTIVFDRGGANEIVDARGVPVPHSEENVIIGDSKAADRHGRHFLDRTEAGLPDFPYVPARPIER